MDRPVPVCRDNAVASRASGDLGDLLAVLVVPLKERLAPVSAGRIGQRDGIALNRVRRGVGAGGLAVVVYILNGVLNGRKFAVELPFLGHVQLFDLSFYANISWFLIPAAEFVTIFCIRSPQAVGGIVNRVNRVHLLFYPRTGFIREVVLDCERLLLPLCSEDHAARGDGVGVASLEERFIGRIVCAVSVIAVGIIFSRNNFNAPALEAITFAGRLSGGQGDGVASEVEVVEVDRAVVIGVVDSGHILDVLSTGSERNGCEVQVAGELVAGFCRIAGLHVLFVYGLVQGRPGDLLGDLVRNAGFEGDVGRQLLSNCAQLCVIAEVQIARQRHCIEGKAADRNVAEAVVAAEAETGQGRLIQRDRRIELARGQRCKIAVQSCIRVDVVQGDMPLRRQGDIGGDGGIKAERCFRLVQIPAVEGIAGLLGSSRLGRLAFVFHVLREGGLAIVRVKGHDPVVRDRADIVLARFDRFCLPDMVRNVVADLIVRIFLGRRVQSPLNRFLRQQLVCARGVREALVVASLCASCSKLVHLERSNVAAANGLSTAVLLLFNRHNVIWVHKRYHETIGARGGLTVHTGCLDHVGASVNKFRDLIEGGRRMGELDQIVNAGFYRRGCPRIVFPADVPAQRVLGVQVVRRILLERLHKVCDREGHDPCASILAFFKRIVLPSNTRLCGILSLTAIHVLVAVLPEAVDAGDGNKAVECLEDIVAGRLFNLGALDFDNSGDLGVTGQLDEFPCTVFVLPRKDGFFIRGRVSVRVFDKPIVAVGFDELGSDKLDLVCPDAAIILPDRVTVTIQNFRVHAGISGVGVDILTTLLRMRAAVGCAADENVAEELIHIRLAGDFGDSAAADIDGQRVLCAPLLAVVVESGVQLGIRVDQPVRTLRITLPRVISRSKLGRHRSRIDIPLFFDRVKRHSANSGAHALRNREFAAMLCIRPARDLNISELCGRGLAGSFYACVNELNNSGGRLIHHPFAGQIFAVRVGFVIYPLERYINPFFRVLRGMSGILQSCVLRIEVQLAGISHTPIRTVAYIGECNHFIRMIATHADELDRVRFQLILAVARTAGSLGSEARFLPDGVQHLGAVELDPRLLSACSAVRVLRFCRVFCFGPANEVIAVSGGFFPINIKFLSRSFPDGFVEKVICGAVVLVIRHRILDRRCVLFPDRVDGLGRIVLVQYDRIAALVARSRSIRRVCPAKERVAVTGQLRSINIKRESSRRRGPIRHFRAPCAVRAVVPLIIQRVGILGSVAVNRKGRYRQHTEHHNQN